MSRRVGDVNHDEPMKKLTGKRSSQPESEPAAPVPDVALLLPAQSLLSQRDTELAPFSYAPFAERA
jgi:hypothetical protein